MTLDSARCSTLPRIFVNETLDIFRRDVPPSEYIFVSIALDEDLEGSRSSAPVIVIQLHVYRAKN